MTMPLVKHNKRKKMNWWKAALEEIRLE